MSNLLYREMCFAIFPSSRDKLLVVQLIYFVAIRKGVAGYIIPCRHQFVSPETKVLCRKKKRIQIGRAMRIAPAEVGNLQVLRIVDEGLRPTATVKYSFSRSKKLERM